MYAVSLSYLCIVASLWSLLLVFHDTPETTHQTYPPSVWFFLWYIPQLVLAAPYALSEWYDTIHPGITGDVWYMAVLISYLFVCQCFLWCHCDKMTEYLHSYVGVVSVLFLPCCLFVSIETPLTGDSWWLGTWYAPALAVPVYHVARWRRFRLYKLQQKSV